MDNPTSVTYAIGLYIEMLKSTEHATMGRKSDLTDAQKTIIDTLNEDGNTQKRIVKELVVRRVLFQSIFVENWLEGNDVAGRSAQVKGMTIVWLRS